MAAGIVETQVRELVATLQGRLSEIGRAELAESMLPLAQALASASTAEEANAVAFTAFDLCRRLYANARSGDAMPLARAILQNAIERGDTALECKAATVCGLLAGDIADIVAAVEYHARALRLAS